jgi:hypothetical protein
MLIDPEAADGFLHVRLDGRRVFALHALIAPHERNADGIAGREQ